VPANPNEFWEKVGQIDGKKIRRSQRSLLHDLENYFVEVQYLPIPDHEKDAAQNHLTRIHREIDRRRNFWLVVVGAIVAIAVGWWQIRAGEHTSTTPADVAFRQLILKPLAARDYPTVEYVIENTSTTQNVTVRILGSSSRLASDPNQTILEYPGNDEPTEFQMAPTEIYHGQIRFPALQLSEQEIKDLKDEKLSLFFFAEFAYEDGAGNKQRKPLCRMFSPYMDGNLTVCPSKILIRQKPK
jgi:hypothetical protein